MQFKSIQIQGFKSFVDKTLIEFPKGITAIVGPNGSGKSNIMDSLRWVLGEQRASELRGGDMEDVIFAGSDHRKPAGYAEVALTLSDLSQEISNKWGTFSEITVARKIYRSGEREYYINNRKCRLKDIKDIFFDTGLGSKSISIIEQERVTKIVNSTPEELRYFLEETAGVVRYKERRKEAETRLRQTQENLSRINDLLSVLSQDLDKLSGQVAKVEAYRLLRHERNELEKMFYCSAYAKLIKDSELFEKQAGRLRIELGGVIGIHQGLINEELAVRKAQEELRLLIKDSRAVHDGLRTKLAECEGDIRQLQGNITSAAGQIEQISSDLESHVRRMEELENRMDELSSDLEEVAELCEDFADRAAEHEEECAEYKAKADELTALQKDTNAKYLVLLQRNTEIMNNINLKHSQISGFNTSIMRLQKEKESLSGDSGDLKARLDAASEGMKELEVQMEHARRQEESGKSELNELEQEAGEISADLSGVEVEYKTLLNQEELLKSELERKFAGSASAIIEKYNAKPYTFYTGNEEALILYPDLLVVDDQYKDRLLAEIEGYSCSFRFIFSSDISRFNPGGELEKVSETLYRFSYIYKKIGEDDPYLEIKSLQDSLAGLAKSKAIAEERRSALIQRAEYIRAEVRDVKDFCLRYEAEIKQMEKEFAAHEATFQNITEHRQRTQKHLEVVEKEINMANDSIQEAKEVLEELNRQKEDFADTLKEAEKNRVEMENKTSEVVNMLDNSRQELASVQRELVRYSERKSSMEAEFKQLSRDKVLTGERINELNSRLSELSTVKVEEWSRLLNKAMDDREVFAARVFDMSVKISDMEKEQADKENGLYALRDEISKQSATVHDMELKIAEQQSKLETARVNMENLSNQVMEAFELDISAIWEEYAEKTPAKGLLNTQIQEVQDKIDSLGALNMAAEQEYAEKKEDFDRQTAQHQDIQSAIANLSELISEIDDSTVKLFEETFNAVRRNFVDVFNRFFGSGSADITLTEPENMLTTGVEITINPPGKKVSHKNLLSGGEKALSALTLLFALFLQKPTPFCFLDEVDAPLDDANVGRFIDMVKSMSENTQFVIITHKHQTMASADSLYGVTMQEAGVSSVLSVQLSSL